LDIDAKANKAFYGKALSSHTIFKAANSDAEVVKELKSTLSAMK